MEAHGSVTAAGPTMKLVLVVWEDAQQVDEGPWVHREGAAEPTAVIFHQVGFLLKLTSAEVVLTATMGEHAMGTRDRIPAGMVRKITELVAGKTISIPRKRRK